jgi:transglutaminase-like putative cysteine protease
VRAVLATLLGGWAAFSLAPLFSGSDFPRLAALLFLVSLAASVAARWIPAALATVAGVVSTVAVIAVVAAPGASVASGGRQLLTSALPVDPTGPTLAVAGAVAAWTMLAAGILAAAGRAPLVVALPPLGCLLLGLAVGASAPALPAWYPVVGVALLAALLASSSPWAARSWRAVVAAVAMVAAGVVAAALITPVAPSIGRREPADARSLVDAPVVPRSGVSPLQQYPALRAGTLALGLRGTVSAPVPRLRMVTLTEFDGTYWTVAADYRRAGTTLPAGPRSDAATTETVTQDVTVDVPGPLSWLPTAGRPTRVSVARLGVDESTGDLVIGADSPVPGAYRATSVRTEPSEDQLRVADPVPFPGGARVPEPVRAFADDAVRDQPRGSAQILALYARLAKDLRFRYDTTAAAPGGHGLFQIQRLLAGHRGTSEQYASAFAVMVRHLGYDARVVMGFRPRYDGLRFTVAGTDVDAWAEVRFAGLGWVTIDTSPRSNPVDGAPGAGSSPGSAADDGDDPVRRAADAPPTSVPENPDAGPAPTGGTAHADGGTPAWVLAAGGLALPVLLLLAVPAVKAARRRRRRAADDPRRATLGAWQETLDRLRDAGLPARRGRSTAEVVDTVGDPVAATLSTLATLADLAAYAPEAPDADVPRRAWAASRETVRVANGRRPVPRRVLALFDPRTLR